MANPRQHLAARRRSRALTQEDLAHKLGVDRSTVVRWEMGETKPQPWARRKLATLLDVSLDELSALLDNAETVEIGLSPDPTPATAPSTALPRTSSASGSPDAIATSLDAIARRYETSPSASLLAEASHSYARLRLLLEDGGRTATVGSLHQIATRATTLLAQLVWDASGRRDSVTALHYCSLAAAHADESHDVVATAEIELRRTYIALYSVGRPPDYAFALAVAESARAKSLPISAALGGVAALHVAEALALTGEYRRCEQALRQAEVSFDQLGDDDPGLSAYSPTQLGRMAGSCYLTLGAAERAETLLVETAAGLLDRPKTRSLVLGNVALSQIRQRQLDAACGQLMTAIDLLETSRGGAGMSVVFAAVRELYPWRNEQLVQDVNDRLLSLMARG